MKEIILKTYPQCPCDECGGAMYAHLPMMQIFCMKCYPEGNPIDELPEYLKWKECPTCKGEGKVYVRTFLTDPYVCPECDGKGDIREVPFVNPFTKEKEGA